MLTIFSRWRGRGAKFPKNQEPDLDYNKLPVMSAEELIVFTGQQNRIRSIKRIITIDNERFQILYLDVIYRFAEMVQLMPASQAHHHALAGGLFVHTLEVIEYSLRYRQQYKLPAFAEQEVQERQRHAWTYAIFVAAILHDIGKRVTMCDFIVDKKIWSPFEDQYLSQSKHKTYKIVFNDPKYHHLHDKIGMTFIYLLPDVGIKFIFSHLNIVKEMSAYILGDKENAGMIGKIISQADQHSTHESLAHSPTRKFSGASLENIGERLMTQLRLMIASNEFIVNKPNANIYTSDTGFTYCVSKVVVDAIREQFHKNNETDIPNDNNRIFDIFQEYGFAETNHYDGKAVHYIQIFHNGSSKVFSVLKFKTNKLFQILPKKFDGKIEEVRNKKSATVTITPKPETIQQNIQSETESNSATFETTVSSGQNMKHGNPFESETVMVKDAISEPVNNIPESETGVFAKTSTEPVKVKAAPPKEKVSPKKIENEKLANDFMNWCREQVISKKIIINESYGQIQKVAFNNESVIAMVTPRIFANYAEFSGMPNPTDKSTFSKIQNAIHQQKLNIKAAKGQVHKYKIVKSIHNPLNKNTIIAHYLFSIDDFCGDNAELKDIISRIKNNTNLTKV